MEKLEITYNNETHKWDIELENALKKVKEFIAQYEHPELVIQNDLDYKTLWKNRTELNNKAKEISQVRKQAVRTITGDFERSCKTLEKEIVAAATRMTEKLLAYKPREENETYILTFKTTDKKTYEKLKGIILGHNIVDIKEEIK